MKKKGFLRAIIIAVLFWAAIPAFSHGGVLTGAKGSLFVIHTQYFDVIFPRECEKSAHNIAEKADAMYLEICAALDTEPYQRFPVTITPSVESLNAYFSSYPYNRIVLYDTQCEESLDMYADTLCNVFYHELTHAVTMNIKSPVMRVLSHFSDAASLAGISLTPFWIEGAAVFMESTKGEGRLNDPFALQLAYQAKAEGKHLSWRDVTGARDTFPGGTDAYIFGALFTQYLNEKYGAKKYGAFWLNAGTHLTFSFSAGLFERTYSKLLSREWKAFWSELEIPEADFPEENAAVSDFEGEKNTGKKRISAMDAKNGVLVFADSLRTGIFLARFDEKTKKFGKAKKILSIANVESLCLSADSRALEIIHDVTRSNTKIETVLFDLEKKRVLEKKLNAQELFSRGKTEGEIVFSEQSPVLLSGALYRASIVKNGMRWFLRVADFDGESTHDFAFPDGVIAHSLHVARTEKDKLTLSFSFVKQGKTAMYPRAGLIVVQSGEDGLSAEGSFCQTDIVGGVDCPVPSADFGDDNQILIYHAHFYDSSRLYKIDFAKLRAETVPLERVSTTANRSETAEENAPKKRSAALIFGTSAYFYHKESLHQKFWRNKHTETDGHSEFVSASDTEIPKQVRNDNDDSDLFGNDNSDSDFARTDKFEAERYRKWSAYFSDFSLLPAAAVGLWTRKHKEDGAASLGLTYVSSTPWGNNLLAVSGGYDSEYNRGGAQLSLSGGNDAFSYTLSGTAAADEAGFMQTADSLKTAVLLKSWFVSSLQAGVTADYVFGHDREEPHIDSHFADSTLYALFSTIHRTGYRYQMRSGFSLIPFLLGEYFYAKDVPAAEYRYVNAGAEAGIRLPFICPISLSATLFPSSDYAASGTARVYLLDFEIQKGIPAVSVFARRAFLSAAYTAKLAYEKDELFDIKRTDEIFQNATIDDYRDEVSLTATLQISPNTSVAVRALTINLALSAFYRPHKEFGEKKSGVRFTAVSNLEQ